MKVLLDENFPRPLYTAVLALGYDVEHIIILGQRGIADSVIRNRLVDEVVVHTEPGDDVIRIVSARPAMPAEEVLFYQHSGGRKR